MSDRFRPITAPQLFEWVFTELENSDSIFGIPRKHFFTPAEHDRFRTSAFGQRLETPFGPAAGPHTQMAQNIVAAWLCGARYIELKTVQTLDELDVSKPCIDMEDEGYNVEWSQELKVFQAFDEYLRAWVLIHALHHRLGFPGDHPGVVFNLSVGYDLAGIRRPNVQWFLDQAQDSATYLADMHELLAGAYPAARDIDIPSRLSDNVTLSTMHGCPPHEIGKICDYLIRDRGLHTFVKCNPTLLGPERVRGILNDELGFLDVTVPDAAFGHDLAWDDAVPLLRGLQSTAAGLGLEFGVKLTNTLEVENWRTVFDEKERMMYLSGRPLHAITVNLAADLAEEFSGTLPMSFSAGADCFNAPELLAAGMQTVTTCTDLLKTGGYLRLRQYLENTAEAMRAHGASDIATFIRQRSGAGNADTTGAARLNLRRYAERVCAVRELKKHTFDTAHYKFPRPLDLFDCIAPPCAETCAIHQKVPQYMSAARTGEYAEALRLVRADNPIPVLLARACDHLCEPACVRTHLDEPLAIRHVKRFIMDQEPALAAAIEPSGPGTSAATGTVAIVGAGPGGLAAASELARAGVAVEIFEQRSYAGGMVGGMIPEYRLPKGVIDQDLAVLDKLGVKIHFEASAGRDFTLTDLRARGFGNVVITVGAQLGKRLWLDGEDCEGVLDALDFLRTAREGRPPELGQRIGVIGAGDTAMDCARTAWRLAGDGVSIIYRRTLEQMPADREEIRCLLEEGIAVTGMAKPQRMLVEDGKLRGLVCRRMEYRGDRDASGRKVPHEIPGEEFEVPLDTLILAISQHAILDFFGDETVQVNERGYIEADPVTFETSVPGVYAGGDVANDGPSSIVEAVADGKAIARAILGQANANGSARPVQPFDAAELIGRRGRRQWRVPVPHTPPGERHDNFNEVVLGYDEGQARTEAARCLDCQHYCSICVGVCPNLALQTVPAESISVELPRLAIEDGEIRTGESQPFEVRQAFQVVVLADLCNECGNCTTFCPTAGAPYRDKPRLYADREEFEAQSDNAFMVLADADRWALEARFAGHTHRIEWEERLHYAGPAFRARLEPDSFAIEEIEPEEDAPPDAELSLAPCATMYALLATICRSMSHWPAVQAAGAADGGRIAHPGYEEQAT